MSDDEKKEECGADVAAISAGSRLVDLLRGKESDDKVYLDTRKVFPPHDHNANMASALVKISPNYSGAKLESDITLGSPGSVAEALFHQFQGEFSIRVESPEEVEMAHRTLKELECFVAMFIESTSKALDEFPEVYAEHVKRYEKRQIALKGNGLAMLKDLAGEAEEEAE